MKFNYGYDAVGNPIAVNDSINGTNAGITGYTYDLLNRITKLTQAGTEFQITWVDMVHDAVNQLTKLSLVVMSLYRLVAIAIDNIRQK